MSVSKKKNLVNQCTYFFAELSSDSHVQLKLLVTDFELKFDVIVADILHVLHSQLVTMNNSYKLKLKSAGDMHSSIKKCWGFTVF